MWKLFKEGIWDYLLGKVLTVLGVMETVWTVVVLGKPEYGELLPTSIDNRVWYGIALVFMFAAFLRMLKVASNYKRQMESPDNIRLVYNEKRYKACKEIRDRGAKEIYRVGIRVIGNEAVESLIVVPDELRRVDDESYKRIPINQIKLHPMVDNNGIVYRGRTPAYYVDVFSHIKGSSRINMCYDKHIEGYIHLPDGEYELYLITRAKPRTNHMGTMIITMNDGNVDIEIKERDYLGG